MPKYLKLLSTGLLAMFLAAGCTSELPNPVGTDLPDGLDSGNPERMMTIDVVADGNVALTDPDIVNYSDNEVLYFGHQNGEESSILVKYNMADIDSAGIAPEEVNIDNISNVKLRMWMINWYKDRNTALVDTIPEERDTGVTLKRHYEVHNLVSELTEDYSPGTEPEFDPGMIFQSPSEGTPGGGNVLLDNISFQVLVNWYTNGHNGIIIREGARPDSTDGFFGFSSKELTHFAELPLLLPEDVYAPGLVITFIDPDTTLTLWPEIDTSTLHVLDEIPEEITEGLVVRTHLRSSPWFSFDVQDLPSNVLVNRASLFVYSDSTKSYGPLTSLVATEVPDYFIADLDSIDLVTLQEDSEMYVLDGQPNIDPYTVGWIELAVTSHVQRYANGVYDGEPMHFMLFTGEDMFPNYDLTSIDPDFYLSRFWFAGTDDSENRPYLEITYTERNTGGE
ncbi:MAG: hypothetical protein GY752_09775 [bacterium]|nr:hypothetical protein [bacterium]MCP4800038.1 hypothetical protein [bacterium]